MDLALNELASRYDCENPHSVEFYASEIFSGRRPPWNGLTSKVERKNILVDVLRVLAHSHDSTVAFGCAVHKASFPNHDPMKLAFEELCSRFDLLLKRLYQAGDVQHGMIILDKTTYETSLQEMARNFRVLGTQWNIIRNLADIPLFVDSRASRLVQLADHVAYSIFRRYEHADTSYLDVVLHSLIPKMVGFTALFISSNSLRIACAQLS